MFLAWHEIKYDKRKFLLIMIIIALIAWLVYVLTGLATGLGDGNRKAIDQWQADGIILSSEANKSLTASRLDMADLENIHVPIKEPIGQSLYTVKRKGQKENSRQNAAVFGILSDSFLKPDTLSGRSFHNKNEAVIASDFKQFNYKLGDELLLGSSHTPIKVVGFFEKSTYNLAPVIYLSLDTWQTLTFNRIPKKDNLISGIVYQKKNSDLHLNQASRYDHLSLEAFIQKIPGYSEQKLTLDGMIYFLFVIATFVIGVFIYVITLQKQKLFGILKVQGIPTRLLATSVLWQTFLLSSLGIVLGMILTFITSYFLPESLPFAIDFKKNGVYSLILLLSTLIGGAFSLKSVIKINPLKAIGG
ncbi:ABC transporter permease [Vagococcus humatus]|uniref:Putative hemin transport system permease protein HrtB n=1 Tax=Vagococcus humatus TaxID=1889241 RepID=A0A3R9YXM1_9ENTE|nr:ABC transporter permease [Vagococcus humatus]RST89797.1 ABC transporter permease [Vagococcus humatus]